MVGGNKEHLNGKKEGASYGELMNAVPLLDLYLQKYHCTQLCCELTIGNEMWKYIKNSVTDGKESQMERYVSYSLDLYFSIKEHTTHKMFWTGDKGVRPLIFLSMCIIWFTTAITLTSFCNSRFILQGTGMPYVSCTEIQYFHVFCLFTST